MEGNSTSRWEQETVREMHAPGTEAIGAGRNPEESTGRRKNDEESDSAGECATSSEHAAHEAGPDHHGAQKSTTGCGQGHASSSSGSHSQCAGSRTAGSTMDRGDRQPGDTSSRATPGRNPGIGHQHMDAGVGQGGPYGPSAHYPGYQGTGFTGDYYGQSHDPEQHYGAAYGQGQYGAPASGHPMGEPHQWPHYGSGPIHHPGFQGHFGGPQGSPHQGPPGDAGPAFCSGCGGHHHSSDQGEKNFGQFADVFGKALQGQATPQDLVGGLLNLNFSNDQFWKGVVVGSVAALLFSSDSVRQALSGTLGGIFGKSEAQTKE